MGLLKNIVRPFVPTSIRRKVHERRIKREMKIWKDLDLHRELAGLTVKVSSLSDWMIYNEIFVERIYDRAIAEAMSEAPIDRMLHVLDLGANVGYFAMRFSQMVFDSDCPDRSFFVQCVEGSPGVCADLSERIGVNPRLNGHVAIRHGLVGKTSGSADIYESAFGAGNSTIPQHWSKPSKVPYIDLNLLVPDAEPIALLKCDIEGSEQSFQDHYHTLLRRTQCAVVELHHGYINPDNFSEGMRSLGFSKHDVLWESKVDQNSLVLYRR